MAETILGTTGNDDLIGLGEDDTVQGLAGDDTLRGQDGDDVLEGGLGDDVYYVTVGETEWVEVEPGVWLPVAREDVVVEAAGEGVDTIVDFEVGVTLGDNIENYVGGLGRGNALANLMTALPAVDTGWGFQGRDAWLWGNGGDDTLRGASGDDSLSGGGGSDLLVGKWDPTDLPGQMDEDSLDGGDGADTMVGGLGMDVYWVDQLGDVVTEEAAPAGLSELDAYYSYHWDTVNWTGEGQYVVADNVEFVHLRKAFVGAGMDSDVLGNAQANVIYSDFGSYTVLGGEVPDGEVRMDGAGGDDTLLGGRGAGDTLLGGEGNDRVDGGGGSDELYGGVGNDNLTGDPFWNDNGADTMSGEDGDDTLGGVGGLDSLLGGAGDDKLDGGFDSDTLEGGDGSDFAYGSYGDDTVSGGAGADFVGGGQGIDVVLGFVDGEDKLLAPFAFDEITIVQDGLDTLISYDDEWSDGLSSMRLVGVDASTITIEDFLYIHQGTGESDSMSGSEGDDYVDGGDGDDTLDGGDGGDGVDGGGGDDTMDGGSGDDTMGGGTGDDTMSGGLGADAMGGGLGDDTFMVDGGDTVSEGEGQGIDRVVASVSFTLGVNLENLTLGDGGVATAPGAAALGAKPAAPRLDGRGNGLDNLIQGSTGVNRLTGADGKDSLNGASGNDTLLGGKGGDKLDGGYGKDALWGDAGRDVLKGGAGADVFGFRSLLDSGDRIKDFSIDQHDVIDLSLIDARAGKDGDQAFNFVNAFSGRAGQATLTYDAARDTTLLQLDVNGDKAADFQLAVNGHLAAGDGWIL